MNQSESSSFIVGLILAVSSCWFIGASFIIKKLGLQRFSTDHSQLRASDGGFGYLKEWIWWAGVLTMGVGEALNFIAYMFAPATLVTPLGALSILVSAVLASKFLGEHLNPIEKVGCVLCILGSIIVVMHSPKDGDAQSFTELGDMFIESGFAYYVVGVAVATVLIAKFLVPRYGKSHAFVNIFICSIVGSLSVICCKAIGLALRETLSDPEYQFPYGYCCLLVIGLLVCISIQMVYLNKALDVFPTSVVNPIYYIFFTTFVIVASSILFREWRSLEAKDVLTSIIGFVVVIIAIFLLSAFKNISFPESNGRKKISV